MTGSLYQTYSIKQEDQNTQTPVCAVVTAPRSYITAMYFSSWSIYQDRHFINELPLQDLTHVFYAFVVIDPDSGKCIHADPWADHYLPMEYEAEGSMNLLRVMKKKHEGLKTLLSIGGYKTDEDFRKISVSREMLVNFVTSTTEMVRKYEFDGVDLNWGYPRTRYESLALVRLICELRAALSPYINPPILTTVLPPTSKLIKDFSIPQLNSQCTFMNIKCFDFCDRDVSERTGLQSNMYGNNGNNQENVHHVISTYISMGASPEKLVLGVPTYGRRFDNPQFPMLGSRFLKDFQSESVTGFRDIDRRTELFDEVRIGAYSYDITRNCLLTYDNPRSIVEKTYYIKERGLGGAFFWDSKGDTPQSDLLQAYIKTLLEDPTYEPN